MKSRISVKNAVLWAIFCLGVGGVASWLTFDGLQRFDEIIQPPLTPPKIVFPIAWSLLLILIGVGFSIVRQFAADRAQQDSATIIFGIQMTFFFCWMLWFFGLGWYGFAALWLCGMLFAIGAMVRIYWKISPLAAKLQLPYLLWCCFALYLNLGVWWLNR